MKKIRVRYVQEAGTWWAYSNDLPNWSAAAAGFDELRRLVLEAVQLFGGRAAELVEVGAPSERSSRGAASSRRRAPRRKPGSVG